MAKRNRNRETVISPLSNIISFYLWLIRVRNLDDFRVGKASLSRNRGFASMSFFSSINIMPRAVLVSPYLDSCSFSLYLKKEYTTTQNVIRWYQCVINSKNLKQATS